MSNIINLQVNGKLFPSWLLLNFGKYKLPEIIRKGDEDPCKEKITKELNTYQKFIGQFINYKSSFKDILLYHGLGSGKTATAINVYNVLYNNTPKWNVFLLIKASLKDDPWLKDLNYWLTKDRKEDMMSNIKFIHYDSPMAEKDFLDAVRKADSSKTSIFIIDEAHNFIRNVYNNISSKQGKRAQVIYDYILQEKIDNENTRIVMLSATPVVNNPFEYALIFNLMRPNILPNTEFEFDEMFITSSNYQNLDPNKKNMFQRRIMGLVSYYIGATPDKYAKKIMHYKNIPMSPYQEKIYNYFDEIEEKKRKLSLKYVKGKVGNDISTYSSYTRQACNFVFPTINKKIDGEKRPRPGQFRIKIDEALVIDEGKEAEEKIKLLKKEEVVNYVNASKLFINELTEYFKSYHRKDKEKKYTLNDDIKTFFNKYNGSFTEFTKEKKKSTLFEEMYKCSPKFIHVIFNILKSKGKVMCYSNYVDMEGLQIFKIYLNFFGFIYFDKKNKEKSKFKYTEYHGGISKVDREENKKVYNSIENKLGDIIKIILISPAGAEGINLSNVRQVHVFEPYWNEVRIEQVIGRAIRQCIHKDLPMKDRVVDVFRYKMSRETGKESADEMMERISRKKNNLLMSFNEAIKEIAVDCELFKAHNMMGADYKCFKFNESSLFDKPIGPAYNKDIEIDDKMNNGLNAPESQSKRIKVREIDVVKKIDDMNFSDKFKVWVNDSTNIVYDHKLNYPVGKLSVNEGKIEKLDKNTYILSEIINIPKITLYD